MSVRNFAAHLGVNERTITKWEAGSATVRPRPELQAALDTVLERASNDVVVRFEAALQPTSAPGDRLAAAAPKHGSTSFDLREVISQTATESTRFLVWAEMENVGDLTLDQLQSELRRLAQAYSHEPPESLFLHARGLRDRAFTLLEGQHRPSYARDLYAVAGWSLTLLAWMSQDFDRPDAAEDHARAAWLCAERADYDGLRAWVRIRQATAAFFLDDFDRAAQYAADGLRYATGTAALLLTSARATHLAHAGRNEQAWEALRQAQQLAENADTSSDELGGLFACSVDRASGFWSEAHLHVGAAHLALQQADEGIAAFEAQPVSRRNLSSERFVRLQRVRAHLMLGQLDDAEAALVPVLDTPSEWRVHNLRQRMNEVYAAAAGYMHEPAGSRIRDAAIEFQREGMKTLPE